MVKKGHLKHKGPQIGHRTRPERLSDHCARDIQLMYTANMKLKFIEMEFILAELLGVPVDVLNRPSHMVTKCAIDNPSQHSN